ncbi:MAG: stage II sporulation protein D [Christensenellales bacterium]|jgi:stage II sporulation protein D
MAHHSRVRFRLRRRQRGTLFLNCLLLGLILLFLVWGIVLCGREQPGADISQGSAAPPVMTVESPVTVRVFDHERNRIVPMELETYVCRVVAAEMPASYEMEALKAQAVAARTLAAEALVRGSRSCAAGSDMCTSADHCQAFDSETACRDKWGSEYDFWWGRVTEAVASTAGIIMTYEGEPIEVFYHAVSGGRTEDVENVFSESLPYLRSVPSEGEEQERNFRQQVSYSPEDFREKIKRYFDIALPGGSLSDSVRILRYYESGRAREVQLGKRTVAAVELRRALGLPSTQFRIIFTASGVVFDCQGYGHGVGMSQAGANVMARAGSDFRDILTHYYTGISLETIDAANVS